MSQSDTHLGKLELKRCYWAFDAAVHEEMETEMVKGTSLALQRLGHCLAGAQMGTEAKAN